MPKQKSDKMKRSFTISPEVFVKLRVYSSKHGIPYSLIIEGLVDAYTEDSTSFPVINFSKYK